MGAQQPVTRCQDLSMKLSNGESRRNLRRKKVEPRKRHETHMSSPSDFLVFTWRYLLTTSVKIFSGRLCEIRGKASHDDLNAGII